MSTATHDLTVTDYPVADLAYYIDNPRQGDVVAIAESLAKVGQYKPIVVNRGTLTGRPFEVLAGNHTLQAVHTLAWPTIKAVTVDVDNEEAARIVLADNRTADLGDYNKDILSSLLVDLPDLEGTGYTPADLDDLLDVSRDYSDLGADHDGADLGQERDGDGAPSSDLPDTPEAPVQPQLGSLAARFGVPPFTVIDTRNGEWKRRGEAWKSLGLKSEVGRDDALLYGDYTQRYANWMDVQTRARHLDPDISRADIEVRYAAELKAFAGGSGTSVFDPALCETLIAWFSPAGGRVLDPWAGGSVRGVVAAALGRDYTGIDLRDEQVQANRQQWRDISPLLTGVTGAPEWLVGDSRQALREQLAESFDMALGCPPYYDLESYSDDPNDLSTLSTAEFDAAMAQTMTEVARCLRPHSFAAFVVGGVRDKRGDLRDMKRCMIDAAYTAGMVLANDAVLVNSVGTVAITAGRSFSAGRSLGRVHQEVVVFVKGDRKTAAKRCGEVQLADLPEAEFAGGEE